MATLSGSDQTQPTQHVERIETLTETDAPVVTPVTAVPVRTLTQEEITLRRRAELVKWSQVITLLFVALEAMIGLRVLLKLIGANPASPFANLVYQFTNIFLAPFNGLTATPSAEGMILEIPALIAMVVYAMLCYFIIRFMWVMFDRANPGAATKYKQDL
jgi:hypothetical protein